MSQHTPLYASHQKLGGQLVDFCGWQLPMHYSSQIQEHQYVREQAGMFDVSHMNVVDIKGKDSKRFLEYLLANDANKLTVPGQALYSCMLNERGGVIDDLITYWVEGDWYRVVLNAATHDKDMAWLNEQSKDFSIEMIEQPSYAMIAVQGPQALALFAKATQIDASDLKVFSGRFEADYWVARTGYTGEDGLEIILPGEQAESLWHALLDAGVKPCGLGARDTLRLEAGMNLYGHDMDEDVLPYEAGLAWTIAAKDERDFIGKQALLAAKQSGIARKTIGLILEKGGVLREGQKVVCENGQEGIITSGSFSPTLGVSIAMARVPREATAPFLVDRRGKLLSVKQVKYPFVRNGKAVFQEICQA